jgi:hypothetical protein
MQLDPKLLLDRMEMGCTEERMVAAWYSDGFTLLGVSMTHAV